MVVPKDSPLSMPVAEPMVAIVVLLLVQVPPVAVFSSVNVAPRQALPVPDIAPRAFTVTVAIEKQPVVGIA